MTTAVKVPIRLHGPRRAGRRRAGPNAVTTTSAARIPSRVASHLRFVSASSPRVPSTFRQPTESAFRQRIHDGLEGEGHGALAADLFTVQHGTLRGGREEHMPQGSNHPNENTRRRAATIPMRTHAAGQQPSQ